MTEPPAGPPEEGSRDDSDRIDDAAEEFAQIERDAIRDFVADATPDMQEAIDRARAELGDEAFDAAVAEVLRRANDPMRYTADLEEAQEQEDLDVLDDDMLLDQLGGGATFLPADDAGLIDHLSAWRDDVESEPLSPGTAPEVIEQIHEFTEQIDRATAPPPAPQERTTPAMTTMEDAQQIRNLGEAAKNRALSALNAIEAKLDELVNAIQGAASGPGEFAQTAANILGADHPGAAQLNGAVAGWADALAPLVERVTAMREAAITAAGGAERLQQEFNAVAATLSGGSGA